MPQITPIPTTEARVKALDRDLSVGDRYRYEVVMMLAARFERALREIRNHARHHSPNPLLPAPIIETCNDALGE